MFEEYETYDYTCTACHRLIELENRDDLALCPNCGARLKYMITRKRLKPDWHISLNKVLDALCRNKNPEQIKTEIEKKYIDTNIEQLITNNITEHDESRKKCPKCGSSNTAQYVYGLPVTDYKMRENLNAGLIKIGGCIREYAIVKGCREYTSPKYYCNMCNNDFGSAPILLDVDNNLSGEYYQDIVTSVIFREGGYPDWTYIKIFMHNGNVMAMVIYDPDAYNHSDEEEKEIKSLIDNDDNLSETMTFDYQFWTIQLSIEKWHDMIGRLYEDLCIHEWACEYIDQNVMDGTQWALDINFADGRSQCYHGSNRFPPYWSELGDIFREYIG